MDRTFRNFQVSVEQQRGELLERIHARDSSLDGVIVFGVKSTGVYCKPSCNSKRAGDSQIVLFRTCEDAESSGFRACKKCRPSGEDPRTRDSELVESIRSYIHRNTSDRITLGHLSVKFNMSPYQIQRKFRQQTGLTPREYLEECRIARVREELGSGNTVANSVRHAGFASPGSVYRKSRQKLGMTPAEYRNGGDGLIIKYTTGKCQYGRVIVASTEHGICYVTMKDTETEMVNALKSEFPSATVVRSPDQDVYLQKIVSYLDGVDQDVEFDLHGTEFQLAVWKALRRIPFGETRSYSEVAGMVGKPKAVRAVASACARNPVSLIIPCHRVIRKNGDLGGYGLGIDRKRAMLKREKKVENS